MVVALAHSAVAQVPLAHGTYIYIYITPEQNPNHNFSKFHQIDQIDRLDRWIGYIDQIRKIDQMDRLDRWIRYIDQIRDILDRQNIQIDQVDRLNQVDRSVISHLFQSILQPNTVWKAYTASSFSRPEKYLHFWPSIMLQSFKH